MCCIQNNGMRSRSTGISYFFCVFFFRHRPFFCCKALWWYETWRATRRSTKDQGWHFSRFISHGCQHNHIMMVKNPLRRPYFLSPEGWVGIWGTDTKAGHGETSAFHWKVLWTFLRRSSYRPVGTPQSGLEMEFARGNFFFFGGGPGKMGKKARWGRFRCKQKFMPTTGCHEDMWRRVNQDLVRTEGSWWITRSIDPTLREFDI